MTERQQSLKLGYYRHYKGGKYQVLYEAKDEATLTDVVVYQSCKDNQIWVRPLVDFTALLPDGTPIFSFVSEYKF